MLNYNKVGKKPAKPAKSPKPASFLQTLQRKVNYLIYFRLHSIPYASIQEVCPSTETLRLFEAHTKLVTKLRDSIKADYERERASITLRRKLAKLSKPSS